MTVLGQTSGNDLDLMNGRLVLVRPISDQAAIMLGNRLRFFKGEWFLDSREGVPYLEFVLGVKNPDKNLLERLFREVILGTQGVKEILDLVVEVDAATRSLNVSMRVLADDGFVITGGTGSPFIVEPE